LTRGIPSAVSWNYRSCVERRRVKGAPRGGRHGLTRPTTATRVVPPVGDGVMAAPARGRRSGLAAAPHAVELTREQEFAYIRSDMRRLFVIAGGLLAIMIVLLFVVSR
jgi:hypothetical protein